MRASPFFLFLTLLFLMFPLANLPAQEILPVLEFPQSGLDDPSTYQGYATRFFRDSAGNTVQIVINQNTGRVINLWADAANESMSFTVRDSAGPPAKLEWLSPGAQVSKEANARFLQYTLVSEAPSIEVGFFLLGSMRKERDFHYQQRDTLPFDSEPFIEEELPALIENLERLPDNERQRHLARLDAENVEELRGRLIPRLRLDPDENRFVLLVYQSTFDAENHLSLELSVEKSQATMDFWEDKVALQSLHRGKIPITIRIGTDSPALTPLTSEKIFNRDFLQFYSKIKAEHNSSLQKSNGSDNSSAGNQKRRFQRLERQVKSLELMSSEEKLMAGLPNFATYFGRDMMMSALMMEPIWLPDMLEHVIASVLRKLSPKGEVSHEEGLGSQAIRENTAEYNKLITEYFERKNQNDTTGAHRSLAQAGEWIAKLQAVTENYRMLDDDFQLPVLAAHYLVRTGVPADRKRAFLSAAGNEKKTSRLELLLRNLSYVAQVSRKYVEAPVATNLVAFPKVDEHRWFSGSWRDSGPGYANGRFAMDINAIWVPNALEAMAKILRVINEIGYGSEFTRPELRGSILAEYGKDAKALQQAISTWRNAIHHFEVHLTPDEIQRSLSAKLTWLPPAEKEYWEQMLAKTSASKQDLHFLALSLDEADKPIPVVNTDPATWLFLEDFAPALINGKMKSEEILQSLRAFVIPYPVGLFVEGVGPLVSNDVYAAREVWENFQRDEYHSPRTVWGREVNLILLGLARQINSARAIQGSKNDGFLNSYVDELSSMLTKTRSAVEASGLKHSELWSYKIVEGKLLPARYSTSSDIQLWNLTDLAVQFRLEAMGN